jgi:murein DD-endopeptidase MepM/ murein hydrolase activator NlpD
MPGWVLKLSVGLLIMLLVGIVLFFAFYSDILVRAAQTDELLAENERLLMYQHKVKLLEDNLVQTREVVGRLIELAGIDYEFPEIPDDSALFAAFAGGDPAILTRSASVDLSWPSGLPIQGFVTQDFEAADPDHFHPGIDIACAVGTPVLSTAAGTVLSAAFDSVYGHVLIVGHSDSVTTVYGHNDTLLVDVGERIMAGSRVALSGSTGISTAPHLHYEVRINDVPIDPLESMYNEER